MKREDALELISKYFDRVIDGDELLELRRWLEASDEHVDVFAEQAVMHTEAHRVLTTQDINVIRDSILGPAALAGDHSDSDIRKAIFSSHDSQAYPLAELEPFACAPAPAPARPVGEPLAGHEHAPTLVGVPGLKVYRSDHHGRARIGIEVGRVFAAALVLLAVGLVALVVLNWPSRDTVAVHTDPIAVATLTQVNEPRWADPEQAAAVGDDLLQGRYELRSGFAELKMDRGARVMLQAPCAFELLDDNTVLLDRGKLVAHVPRSAHRFTVKTEAMDIVDLGTEFGVDASFTRTDAAVFDGLVELHKPIDRGDARRLGEGWRASVGIDGSQADAFEPLSPDHGYVRTIAESRSLLEVSGACRFYRTGVDDVAFGRLFTGDDAIVFLERRGVTVSEPQREQMAMSLARARGDRKLIKVDYDEVASVVKVDSYLIHRQTDNDEKIASFTVRFPRRVVGVYASANSLYATDPLCGRPGTRYPKPTALIVRGEGLSPWRGLEAGGENPSDFYHLSADGRTLEARIESTIIDQVRVLIESEPDA